MVRSVIAIKIIFHLQALFSGKGKKNKTGNLNVRRGGGGERKEGTEGKEGGREGERS